MVNQKAPKDRDIAMVFQNYALYPHMTVRENMGFALKLAKVDSAEIDRKVEEAAKTLDLTQHLDRKPANLSGGQRQRVAMGRAIVRDPAAFLMDEPLSNLDAKLRVQMRTEVSRIQQRLGTTTVYVTHDQTEAMTLGDRVAVMRSGVLQQVGSPMELYNEPKNLFVAGFIGSPAMNFMPGTLDGDRLKLPMADVAVFGDVGGASGDVIAGIRPEDFEDATLVGEAKNRGATFKATIDVLESMGSELYAHFSAGHRPGDRVRRAARAGRGLRRRRGAGRRRGGRGRGAARGGVEGTGGQRAGAVGRRHEGEAVRPEGRPEPGGRLSPMPYIEGFIAAVPTANRDAYIESAREGAEYFKKLGATRTRRVLGRRRSQGRGDRLLQGRSGQGRRDGHLQLDRVPGQGDPRRGEQGDAARTPRWRTWRCPSTPSGCSGAGSSRSSAARSLTAQVLPKVPDLRVLP